MGACVNFCSRIEFQKLEVEENAGRHVGLYSTTLKGSEHCWAGLCFLTLPTEMKTFIHFWDCGSKGKDILRRWPELNVPICFLKRQNAVLLQTADLVTLVFLRDWVTLRADILPKQGQATGTAGFLMNLEPRPYLLLSRSPSGEEGQGEASEREDCPGLRAQSSEPHTCYGILHWALRLRLEGVFKDWYSPMGKL